MFKDFLSQISGSMGGTLGGLLKKLSGKVTRQMQNTYKSFTFQALPKTLDEFKALPEATLSDPYAVAALSVLALTRFPEDREACFEMLSFLKGPDPLTTLEKSQIADRFTDGKDYKPLSFFEGAVPGNNYTPAQPYKVRVSSNPYSFQNKDWGVLYMHSGGADNERPVRLRKKPSTGQWFLVEIQYLGDIRVPVAQDKWA